MRCIVVTSVVSGFALLLTTTVGAQRRIDESTPCSEKPPIQCSYGGSNTFWTSINLKMDGSVCKFDRQNMDAEPGPRVSAGIGGGVEFRVCNACDADVRLMFDSWTDPWSQKFAHVNPAPSPSEEVTFTRVPCRSDYLSLTASGAKEPVTTKGTVHVSLIGQQPHDRYDPELEIEGGLRPGRYVIFAIMGLVALLAAWWLGRRAAR